MLYPFTPGSMTFGSVGSECLVSWALAFDFLFPVLFLCDALCSAPAEPLHQVAGNILTWTTDIPFLKGASLQHPESTHPALFQKQLCAWQGDLDVVQTYHMVFPRRERERDSGTVARVLWGTWSFPLFLESQGEDYTCRIPPKMMPGVSSSIHLSWFSFENIRRCGLLSCYQSQPLLLSNIRANFLIASSC